VGKLVIGGEVHWGSNRETGGIDAISIFLGRGLRGPIDHRSLSISNLNPIQFNSVTLYSLPPVLAPLYPHHYCQCHNQPQPRVPPSTGSTRDKLGRECYAVKHAKRQTILYSISSQISCPPPSSLLGVLGLRIQGHSSTCCILIHKLKGPSPGYVIPVVSCM
jgi:hypothetical protein